MAYQRYLLLSTQQSQLQESLAASPVSPTFPSPLSRKGSNASTSASYPIVPTFTPSSSQDSATTAVSYFETRSPVADAASPRRRPSDTPSERSTTSDKLYECTREIRCTLTELLNCDSVKHDERFRTWVQEKLMDAEHDIKGQRRRRSSLVNNADGLRGWGNAGATGVL